MYHSLKACGELWWIGTDNVELDVLSAVLFLKQTHDQSVLSDDVGPQSLVLGYISFCLIRECLSTFSLISRYKNI